jgi:hypothetical protein
MARSPRLVLISVLPILLAMTVSCGTCPPTPFITSITPSSATAGRSRFLLTVNGNEFRHDSAVSWNGSFRITSVVSSQQLVAIITAADITQPGTVLVFVFNPPEGRHHVCLRWNRSDVHDRVSRQKLEPRLARDQSVMASSD